MTFLLHSFMAIVAVGCIVDSIKAKTWISQYGNAALAVACILMIK